MRRLRGVKEALELPTIAGELAGRDVSIRVALPLVDVLLARRALESTIAMAAAPALVIEVLPPVALAPAEIARSMPGTSAAQVEDALALLVGWVKRSPARVRVDFARAWAFFTPWTSLEDLRQMSDAIRRLGLAPFVGRAVASRVSLDPESHLFVRARSEGLLLGEPASPGEPVAWRFADESVAAAVLALTEGRELEDEGALDALDETLDAIAGVARGKQRRRLAFVPTPAAAGRDANPINLTHRIELRGDVRRVDRRAAALAITGARQAAAAGAREVVIGGTDPVHAWFLEDLVALCRDLGVIRVTIETAATDIGDARATELASAGLTNAKVPWHGAAEAGVASLGRAGIEVELVVPLSQGGETALLELVARAPSLAGGRLRAIEVRCAPGLDVPEAARAIDDACRLAPAAGVEVRMGGRAELPPCVFDRPSSVAGALRVAETIVTESSGAYERFAACEACAARHACPGGVRTFASALAPHVRALREEELGGAVPVAADVARYESELESRWFVTDQAGALRERRVLRVNFHCNQACGFCFVARELTMPDPATIFARLDDAAAHDAELALSGGEPTLNPRLFEYVAHARRAGIRDLELQTNAVKMADPAYAKAVAASGLTHAFVSLHGVTAAVSDRVTSAPGTFDRTVLGLKNLVAAGLPVRVNFVMCGANHQEFELLPAFADRELRSLRPGARVELVFSFVAPSTDRVPRDARLIPRFRDVAGALSGGYREARRLGFDLLGFESQCGVPPCFLPEEVRERFFDVDLPASELEAATHGFVKAPACGGCAFQRRCFGVRAGYAEMYGTDELTPL